MNLDQQILADFSTAHAEPESIKLSYSLDLLPTEELLKLAGFGQEAPDYELQKQAAIGQILSRAAKAAKGIGQRIAGGGAGGRMAAAEKGLGSLKQVVPGAASKATAAAANVGGSNVRSIGSAAGRAAQSARAAGNRLKVAQILAKKAKAL